MLLKHFGLRQRAGKGKFQRAPTLGGECYFRQLDTQCRVDRWFQRAPTLGGECYVRLEAIWGLHESEVSTGTHPWG